MSAVLKLTSGSMRVAYKQLMATNRVLYPITHANALAQLNNGQRTGNNQQTNKRFYSSSSSSGQESSSSSSSNGKWIFLALLISGAGGAGIAYQHGLLDKFSSGSSTTGESKAADKTDKKKLRIPADVADIPKDVPYLLIGGGTASFAAFRAIKSHDPKAKVVVISNELEMPYMRPPLSKEIWLEAGDKQAQQSTRRLTFRQWNGVERSIFYEPDDFYTDAKHLNEAENGGVTVVRGYHVKSISVDEKKAVLDDGTEIQYGKCLIATGSVPKRLDIFTNASASVQSQVSVFKTIADFETLSEKLKKMKSIAVVGGGFLGSEMSCALAKYGGKGTVKVHQVFREKGNMGKVLPQYLSNWTMERVKEEGVQVHNGCSVAKVEQAGKQVQLTLSDGSQVLVDHVIVAVGSEPNTELAEGSKLETDEKLGGYIVNAELLARNNVYVAGDASNFYDPHLGRRRVEHHDHAVVSGRLAGENMVGLNKPYTHQSMFWSDLGPRVGYEAIGVIDSSLKTVAIFAKSPEPAQVESESEMAANTSGTTTIDNGKRSEDKKSSPDEFDKGVVLYLRGERIVGILLWNVFNRINIARKVIAEDIRTTDYDEVAKLFNIYEGHE